MRLIHVSYIQSFHQTLENRCFTSLLFHFSPSQIVCCKLVILLSPLGHGSGRKTLSQGHSSFILLDFRHAGKHLTHFWKYLLSSFQELDRGLLSLYYHYANGHPLLRMSLALNCLLSVFYHLLKAIWLQSNGLSFRSFYLR